MGILSVDADGRVWSLATRKNGKVVPRPTPLRAERMTKRGYPVVHAWITGRQYLVTAHRLVWTVLRGPIPQGLDINHIDGKKTNNHPSNLELATRSENILHSYRAGLRSKRNIAAEWAPQVRALRLEGKSFVEIAQVLGVTKTTVYNASKWLRRS